MPRFMGKVVTDNLTMAYTTWKVKETGQKELSYEYLQKPSIYSDLSWNNCSYSQPRSNFHYFKEKIYLFHLTALPKPCVHHGPCLLTMISAVPFQSSPKPHFVHTESSKTFGPLHSMWNFIWLTLFSLIGNRD